MTQLATLLAITANELDSLAQSWAIIGGLAVSVHADPRFTRDIDIVIAIKNDFESEQLVYQLQQRNFQVITIIEQEAKGRLATVRLTSTRSDSNNIFVDLLFASSGIEAEIVQAAIMIEVLPGQLAPIASVGHLIALKLLSRDDDRPQDSIDLVTLLRISTDEDIEIARESVRTIMQRGFNRGRSLEEHLQELIAQFTD